MKIQAVEIPIVWGCNNRCNYCAHFSQYMSDVPVLSVSEVDEMCRTWSIRLKPDLVTLIGGEPFLHHDIITICRIVRQCWYSSRVRIKTNGMMLEKLSDNDIEKLALYNIEISPTQHHAVDAGRLQARCKYLDCLGITTHIDIHDKDNDWQKYYQIIDGKPHVYDSDPKVAFERCNRKYRCATLKDNCLYHCSCIPYTSKMVELGRLDDPKGRIQSYRPATPDLTGRELQEWWDSDFWNPVCGICLTEWKGVSLAEKNQK